jgi:dTMP kinase
VAKARKKFLEWVEEMEFSVFGIVRPDIVIYLDVSLSISQRLSGKNTRKKKYLNGEKDFHEGSLEHLKGARNSAMAIAKKNSKWKKINCLKNGRIMTKEEISDIIMEKLKSIAR